MQDFIPGQRWVSSAELNLGLGTVIGAEHRTVTLVFPACGETRTYARQSAPLSRVAFAPGDSIISSDDVALTVESVSEHDGLVTYHGVDEHGDRLSIEEQALNPFMQLNRPGERLFSHQVDALPLFELRRQSWAHLHRLLQSDLYGLTGCRTSLIPHQLYIAHEVGHRHAPRVLLADEVGLGKTIEAGLILHQQLLTERAKRVLIVVPESLVHQWLVEMLRRFNLMFSIFNVERCEAIEASGTADNPFHSAQQVLCSLEFLAANPRHFSQALDGDWDLLVVDEAHHLHWSPDHASLEYRLVEQLATRCRGVLLLTATPEQLGRASHFARLRLLDPHRFPDLDAFIREEERYEPVARAVAHLLSDEPLDDDNRAALERTLGGDDNDSLLDTLQQTAADDERHRAARHQLIDRLLDRHGTGRVLFRNTRSAVQGFPERHLNSHPLAMPPAYADCLAESTTQAAVERHLYPERCYADSGQLPAWTRFDPRVSWLAQQLSSLKPEKILVITAHAGTAVELADTLHNQFGLHAAVFHEGLSLVERDRAAAYFADREFGTQALICSEIGSEGRNFQFAHHLVLFDLPLNPDLLEQRIGRLDRIGQTQRVEIHVPFLENTAQAVLHDWYHQGLAAFEHTCPAGPQIFTAQQSRLHTLLAEPTASAGHLIEEAAHMNRDLNIALQRGRDRLLEYNSCRQPAADRLCARARDMEDAATIAGYMDKLFDAFGAEHQPHSEGCMIVHPGDHMLHPLPGLPDDGLTVTYDRDIALAFEDTQYLSWEHPLVRDSMEMLLSSELGNCSVCAVRYPGVRAGTLLLECLFIVESGHQQLAGRYHLPPALIRIVLDEQGGQHDENLTPALISAHNVTVDTETARQVIQAREPVLRTLLQDCVQLAEARAPDIIDHASQGSRQALQNELERLRALLRVNSSIRREEVEFFERQQQLLTDTLRSASPRLDAVRVMVAT